MNGYYNNYISLAIQRLFLKQYLIKCIYRMLSTSKDIILRDINGHPPYMPAMQTVEI